MKKETIIFILSEVAILAISTLIVIAIELNKEKEQNEIYENIAEGIQKLYEEEE